MLRVRPIAQVFLALETRLLSQNQATATGSPGAAYNLKEARGTDIEVLGENAFLALMPLAKNAREEYHFGSVVQLETENSWLDFLTGLKPLVDQFLSRFKEIAAAGTAEDQDVLQSMIIHEESFVSWIDKEITGEEGSLDTVIVQLNYPLQSP